MDVIILDVELQAITVISYGRDEDLRRDLSRVELQIRLHFSDIVNSSAEINTLPGNLAVFCWARTGLDLVASQRNNVESTKNLTVELNKLL